MPGELCRSDVKPCGAVIWRLRAFAKESLPSIGAPALTWRIAGVGDGAGRSDVPWRDTSSGDTIIWQMNGFA